MQEVVVPPITDPQAIAHPKLRELASEAVWVAKLEEAADALDDLLIDPLTGVDAVVPTAEQVVDATDDPLRVALAVVTSARDEADAALEGRLAAWLAADPEHWPISRLALLDAWRDALGNLHHPVPSWVRVLTTNAALAHVQQDPYGRQRGLDLD
ncbi:MAG TPA: hypothetical protein VGR16_15270 [Thermomicrobiales bacterium]|nr:hypothetical protein [Thermomicrobiales bacterium]